MSGSIKTITIKHWQDGGSDAYLTSSSCVLTSHQGIYFEWPSRLSLSQRQTLTKWSSRSKCFVWGLTRGRHIPHAQSVGPPTCSNLGSIPLMLLFLSHLASPFLNLDNLFSEYLKPERGLLPRHNGGLFSPQGGSLDSQYYTLPVIVCLIIHLLFPPGRQFTVYSYYI